MILITATAVATSTRLATYYSEGNSREFHRLLIRRVAMCAVLGAAGIAVAIVAGKPIVTLLFKPEGPPTRRRTHMANAIRAIAYLASILGYAVTATRQIPPLNRAVYFCDGCRRIGFGLSHSKIRVDRCRLDQFIINGPICQQWNSFYGGFISTHTRASFANDWLILAQHLAHHASLDAHHMAAKDLRMLDRTFGTVLEEAPRPARILDLGCGVGFLLNWLSRQAGVVAVGVDASPGQVEIHVAVFPSWKSHARTGWISACQSGSI